MVDSEAPRGSLAYVNNRSRTFHVPVHVNDRLRAFPYSWGRRCWARCGASGRKGIEKDEATAKNPSTCIRHTQAVPACTICLGTAAALRRLSAPGVVSAHTFTQAKMMRRYCTAAGAHLLALCLPFHTHAIPSICLTAHSNPWPVLARIMSLCFALHPML